jgi:hypothetical protein
MKKLLTIIGIAIAFTIAVFGMTACPGGDNVPNNPKGQVVNQPSGTPPPASNTPPAGGTEPAGGSAAPAGGGGTSGEEEEMPGGGE